ncbi:MAG: PASTA domain-containing protein [Leptospiraceae bacterium]|nr:PASTA domain-containing protein [Leptospiraceae bacterium]MCB1315811.1 PASTA domain-containing protein [Leptospiraceae bacterium]
MSDKPGIEFLTRLSRLVLYFSMALAVFFGLAVLIYVLRGEDSRAVPMPDLVGKYYVDVHNELNRLQLRVNVETRHFPDQSPGIILHQSVAVGENIEPREKLYLVVNQPDPLLQMPSLLQISEQRARAALEKITMDEEVYHLEIGAISEIITDEFPADTVLAQFPPPNSRVTVDQKVYLLVTRQPAANTNQPVEFQLELAAHPEQFIDQNVTIVTDYMNRNGIDYRIETVPEETGTENASISKIEMNDNGVRLFVRYHQPTARFINGYELLELELDEAGQCVGEIVPDEADRFDAPRTIFQTMAHAPDEEIQVIFYRTGTNRVRFQCGGENVFDEVFSPDNLG